MAFMAKRIFIDTSNGYINQYLVIINEQILARDNNHFLEYKAMYLISKALNYVFLISTTQFFY